MTSSEQFLTEQREAMVSQQLRARGILDPQVLEAIRRVPRHRFVPNELEAAAYSDAPQSIGYQQTISQPYVVALMTEQVYAKSTSRALDVGTGSGYQAAILAEICEEVFSVEIVSELAESARTRLAELGYSNIHVRNGDGYRGWPEHAPYDVITVAAAPDHIPNALIEQLAIGGRLVIPLGCEKQQLLVIEKLPNGDTRQELLGPVAFVPMTGKGRPSSKQN